ncbi:MAG: hypothetical protein ABIV51_04310 [Saprospiraceae bacterium]
MQLPVSLDLRIDQSKRIALIHLEEQVPYMMPDGNIYTLNIGTVTCWLKNAGGDTKVGIITYGGAVGDRAQITFPNLDMDLFHDYLIFLDEDNQKIDSKDARVSYPGIQQCMPYCQSQGSFTYEFGKYHDLLTESPKTEKDLFQYIETRLGTTATTPEGQVYQKRNYTPDILSDRAMPITSFSPNPTNVGTIVTAEFLTITGSGFGPAPGTVFFRNANDGGATSVGSGLPSDNVSWSGGSVQVKPLSAAGTGPIQVNAETGGPTLTVNYSHINITSDFYLFPAPKRQRYYLRNKNGNGGYSFTFNNIFAANLPARSAFNRSLASWRCASLINWVSNVNSSSIDSAVADGVNIVSFVTTLPFPAIGLATSRFNGSGTAVCSLDSTVWWLDEIDVEFGTPVSQVNWNYGPGLPGGSQVDFETVATHELGHAHGLGHRIAPGETMNYQIITGTTARTPSVQERNGAIAKMAYSTGPTCFVPGGSGSPIVPIVLSNCNTVPLQWLSFFGTYVQSGHELQWKVAGEYAIRNYEVERSSDGIHFERIKEVEFRPTQESENTYVYTDNSPLSGLNYYRIRQNDLDGIYTYSQIITLKRNKDNEVLLYPVPSGDKVKLQGFTGRNLSLRNMQGQVVREWVIAEGEVSVSLQDLPAGLYWLYAPESGEVWKVIYQP